MPLNKDDCLIFFYACLIAGLFLSFARIHPDHYRLILIRFLF